MRLHSAALVLVLAGAAAGFAVVKPTGRAAATPASGMGSAVRTQDATRAQELRRGPLIFRFAPGDSALAEQLARTAALPLPALPPDAPGDSILILLANDEAAFDSLTGGRVPEWGAGVAFPDAGVIVLPAYASRRGPVHELAGVLRHEIAHVALQQYLAGARVPRWFTEGYATWVAGQFDANAGWMLRLAFLTDRAPPLDSLVLDWPAHTADARVAYLLSASAVQWLHERGGERVLRMFLERWKLTGAFETALFDVYGLRLHQLEEHWSTSVRRRFGWLLFLAQTLVIWAILAVIVIALWVIRRQRNRRKLERLRATEIPDDPAFWVVPPAGEDTVTAPPDGPDASAAPPEPGKGAGQEQR